MPVALMRVARIGVVCLGAALVACGSLPRDAVPPQRERVASIPGFPEIRARAGTPSDTLERDLALSFAQESASDFPRSADGTVR